MLVEPAGSGLMASPPPVPVEVVVVRSWGVGEEGEQAPDFGDGERDEAGVGGWFLIAGCGWGRLCAGFGVHARRGGGADRQGHHGQGEVTDQGVVAADLAVVETELVFSDLEVFFDRPAHPGDTHQ